MVKQIFLINLFLLVISLSDFCTAKENVGVPISLTKQETLSFLVTQSDLIAIVEINEEINAKAIIPFFKDNPRQVVAIISSIIKGKEDQKNITISQKPKHLPKDVVRSSIAIRAGKNLVFLSRNGTVYNPTTRFSILDIFRERVYPVWKQDKNNHETTSGTPINIIINEINCYLPRVQEGEFTKDGVTH